MNGAETWSHSVFHQNAHTKEKESISKKGIICLSLSLKATFNLSRTHVVSDRSLFKNLNNNWSFFSAIVGFLCLHLYYAMQYLYIKDLSISIMLTSLFRLCSTYEIDCDKNFGDMYLICHTNLSENIVFWPVIFFSSDEWFLFYKIARVQK